MTILTKFDHCLVDLQLQHQQQHYSNSYVELPNTADEVESYTVGEDDDDSTLASEYSDDSSLHYLLHPNVEEEECLQDLIDAVRELHFDLTIKGRLATELTPQQETSDDPLYQDNAELQRPLGQRRRRLHDDIDSDSLDLNRTRLPHCRRNRRRGEVDENELDATSMPETDNDSVPLDTFIFVPLKG